MSYCCKDKFKLQEVGDSFQLLQGGSVTSVNGKVGAVVLTAEDVGALPDTYEAPVTSVNTQTGDVVLDAGDIAYESTTVEEELGAINSALSSLQSVTEIIDTASGAIASFPDGSGLPMRSLLAQIEPQQEGSGDPSPENVRPISGWTGLTCAVAGKNLLPDTAVITGGYVRAGNPSSTSPIGSFVSSSQWSCTNFVAVKANATYTTCIPAYTSANGAGLCFYKSDETVIDAVTLATQGNANYTFTTPANCAYIRFSWNSGTDTTAVLVAGSTPSSYVPYVTPTTITCTWQTEAGTVYGGTVDVVSGVLTVTHRYVLLDGTQTINKHSTTAYNGFHLNLANNGLPACASTEDGTVGQFSYYKLGKLINANGNAFVGSNTIQFRNDSLTTKDEAIAYLTANPLQVVYPLAQPQTYQLTPQQISTLIGNNTVFVDTGSVSVTYQASIKGYIDKVLGA